MRKIKFREFLEIHASLMPGVNHAPGSPAFVDLLRGWNTTAILFPEKCADVIIWGKNGSPVAMANDINVVDTLEALKDRPLSNIPSDYRSDIYQKQLRDTALAKEARESGIELNKETPEKIVESKDTQDKEKTESELPKNKEGVVVPSHAKDTKPQGKDKVPSK